VGFAVSMRQALTVGWLWFGAVLLVLRGCAQVVTGVFTDAPATVAIHSLATLAALLSMLGAFTVIGLGLRRTSQWRGWGIYSLVTALLTLALIAIEFWAFRPGAPLAPAQVGGLLERALSVETLAWYVAFGWRLFRRTPHDHVRHR
jgi:hypothetical protein